MWLEKDRRCHWTPPSLAPDVEIRESVGSRAGAEVQRSDWQQHGRLWCDVPAQGGRRRRTHERNLADCRHQPIPEQ